MNATRNNRRTRTQAIAAGAAAILVALTAAGCSSSESLEDNSTASEAPAETDSLDGTWIAISEDGQGNVLKIDGDHIVYSTFMDSRTVDCAAFEAALDAIPVDFKVDLDADGFPVGYEGDGWELISTGTIQAGNNAVMWDDANRFSREGDDAGQGSLSVGPAEITLDHIFHADNYDVTFVPIEDARAKAYLPEDCA